MAAATAAPFDDSKITDDIVLSAETLNRWHTQLVDLRGELGRYLSWAEYLSANGGHISIRPFSDSKSNRANPIWHAIATLDAEIREATSELPVTGN